MRPLSWKRRMAAGATAALCALALVLVREARADDDVVEHKPADPARVWLYSEGADNLARGQSTVVSTFTYTDTTTGALRPLASNVGILGALYELRGRIGLGHALSLDLTGAKQGLWTDGEPSAFAAGVSLAVVAVGGTRVSTTVGVLREIGGAMGVWANAAFTEEVGGLRLLANAHAEHVAAHGRDMIDLMVTGGASYRVVGPLRAGVEYVAQDLEAGIAEGDAEGGMRHLVGPTLAVELPESHLSLTGGPAFGLSAGSPSSLARAALAYSF